MIARYHRLKGDDTWFLMGNDEHSQNVFRRAQEQGKDPLTYCDEMEQVFREVWRGLDISFDDFIRTTDQKRHFPAVQRLVQACKDSGDIYEGTYEGPYCVSCEEFKPEKDLVDGLCPIHKTKPEWIKERNWFFRLSKYQQPLLKFYEEHPSFIEPEVRRNEVLRFVEAGLEDLSISRAGQSWGIPLPFDPKSVVYVWFDALTNYAAAVGYGWDEKRFSQRWPADLHIVGKDITRFHCVIWPAMLMSAGLPLPGKVFGHGWVFFKGERMSKTMGNIVDPLDAAKRFGPDPLRLYLTKEVPYGGDGDFTWERFEEKYNADLANNLGNLVNRVASMTERYRGGRLKAQSGGPLATVAAESVQAYGHAMDRLALHEGVASAYRLISAANEFIAETQPWSLAKDPAHADRLSHVLYDVAEAVRIAAVLLLPVMPSSAAEILRRLGETTAVADLRLDTSSTWRASGERAGTECGRLVAPPGRQGSPQREREHHTCHRRRACFGSRGSNRTGCPCYAGGSCNRACRGACCAGSRAGPGRGTRTDLDRRLHEGAAEGREDPRGRARAEVEETGAVEGGCRRSRTAHHSRGYRRELRARTVGRPHHRGGGQSQARKADGNRVEWHGARCQPRRRRRDAVERRARAARHARPLGRRPPSIRVS